MNSAFTLAFTRVDRLVDATDMPSTLVCEERVYGLRETYQYRLGDGNCEETAGEVGSSTIG